MVNTDDFIKRLETIFDYYTLTASSFADKIGVQRSSLSHLLSGRNKPSLDFILKVTEVFPEIDLYWILNGKGSFPKNEENEVVVKNNFNTPTSSNVNLEIEKKEAQPNTTSLFSEEHFSNTAINEKKEANVSNIENLKTFASDDEIDAIVVFYKDGTFKKYRSK